jgi:hypothetical protein
VIHELFASGFVLRVSDLPGASRSGAKFCACDEILSAAAPSTLMSPGRDDLGLGTVQCQKPAP